MLPALLAVVFMYQSDTTIVNVAMPRIQVDLGVGGAVSELIIAGYLLASASILIIAARLGDLHGHKLIFLIGATIFTLGSLACGLAPDAMILVLARVVQGIGGGLAFPQVLTCIQLFVPEGRLRERALGGYPLALAGGAVIGQLAGGLLVTADIAGLGWRPIFLINLPIGIAAVIVGKRTLPSQRTYAARRLDGYGAVALFGAVLLLLLPLSLGAQTGWPAWCWLALGCAVILFVIFVRIQRRLTAADASPLIDLRMISIPGVAWGLWPYALVVATYWALLFTWAHYLQGFRGASPLVSGATLLPWVICFGIGGRLSPRVSRTWQSRLPWVGCLILVLAYGLIGAVALSGTRSLIPMLALLAVGGFGLGVSFGSTLLHLTRAATPRFASDISGVFSTAMQVGGSIGVAALGSLYLGVPGTGGQAFGIVTWSFAAIALVAAAMARRATRGHL